ncbi:Protein CBG18896 [Caenorhabditis briggsae]|uniref:Glycosyltransferase family 92 protein n=1 Tax=Caenorhabditis briggsae TaxID=6238 RepID=A8XUB1_CAEBR|nr:Protein CBG18896 [Caenorhabditis briggsae]CAP36236.2 Protein CBG18896 [Caenorhabditis briggsae]
MYHDEVERSRLDEKNVKLLSAFDFRDGFVTVSITSVDRVGWEPIKIILEFFLNSDSRTPAYCHYFDKSHRPIPDASRPISFYTDTTARCPIHGNSDARFIALSYSFRKSSQLVPILIRRRQFYEKMHDLTVCVEFEPQPNWLEISAFIEYHRSLGFSFFHFTTVDLDAYNRRMFDDYIRLGIVKLTSLRSSNPSPNDFKTIQRSNCLLHARLDSRLVTFLRIDERVSDIPFFNKKLWEENVSDTRIVTNAIKWESSLEKYSNESAFKETLRSFSYKKHVQFRKVIEPERIQTMDQISEDFVYKKASTHSASIPESVFSSVISRVKYNYDTRPIYCDEFDITVLSWCPVNLYHCRFRDEEDKKIIMEKREEARKVRYKQETIRW